MIEFLDELPLPVSLKKRQTLFQRLQIIELTLKTLTTKNHF